MEQINIESLKKYGFEADSINYVSGTTWLIYKIKNWSIQYIIRDNKFSEFLIHADGWYDFHGEFDISHIKDIETLDRLIKIMTG